MEYDIQSLNEEQLAPLREINGAVLVTAGAGSGKTRLLTHRVAYLIKERGVSPYNILAITFTNKAAGEMKERISTMVEGADRVWISTFHSMCARILRNDIEIMPPFTRDFSIYSESDSDKLIKEVLAEQGIADDKMKKSVSYHLSNWKNGSQSLDEYVSTHEDECDMRKIGQVIEEYQNKLKKNNALDFDDLLRKTVELFKNHPQILDKYAQRFEYILVDEFQDTNTVQYNIVKMLTRVHGNLFVVGDEDQCIYSWRGANFQNIFNLKKDFPDVKVFKLERNYRSTNEIISVANNVIKNNKARLNKNMWTDKKGGEVPTLYNAYDERDEALYVAKTIERLHGQGYEYADFAVLMRINALSRSFEEAFLSYDIPHRIYGGFKFYERAEIKNVIGYLRLFVNPKDDVSFARVINFPKRGIGDGTIAKLHEIDPESSLLENVLSQKLAENGALYKKFLPFIEGYRKAESADRRKLSDFVECVLSAFGVRGGYNMKDEEDLNKLFNIGQFVSSVKEFEALNPDATLGEFLESITLSSENDEIGQGGAVTIATVHAVKGLEFKVVFVVGLEEGIFPISRAMNSTAELEEERRLMYVALTRAEERLYLSHCAKRYLYRDIQYQMASRFCRELGLLSLSSGNSRSGISFSGAYGGGTSSGYGSSSGFSQRTNGGYGGGQGSFSQSRMGQDVQTFGGGSEYSSGASMRKLKSYAVDTAKTQSEPKKDISVFSVGQKVSHPRFGEGEILSISSDGLVADINFEDVGTKSLMLELAPLSIIE